VKGFQAESAEVHITIFNEDDVGIGFQMNMGLTPSSCPSPARGEGTRLSA